MNFWVYTKDCNKNNGFKFMDIYVILFFIKLPYTAYFLFLHTAPQPVKEPLVAITISELPVYPLFDDVSILSIHQSKFSYADFDIFVVW